MCAETAAGAGVAVGSAVGAGVAVGVAVGATAVTVVTEGVDVGVGVGVLSCPPLLPLSPLPVLPPVLPLSPPSPPVVPLLPESSVLVGTFVTTAVRVMVKGFFLSFASAAKSSALRVLKSSVPLYSLSLCVQALTL